MWEEAMKVSLASDWMMAMITEHEHERGPQLEVFAKRQILYGDKPDRGTNRFLPGMISPMFKPYDKQVNTDHCSICLQHRFENGG